MKKTALTILAVISIIAASAQSVTIPTNKLLVDSALYELGENNSKTGGWINPVKDNGFTTFDLTGAFEPTIPDLGAILNNGGSIQNYQVVLKGNVSLLDMTVPAGLPSRLKQTSSGTAPRTIGEWILHSNIYVDGSTVYFITVNMAGQILTGGQVQTLLTLDPGNIEVLLTTDPEFISVQP